MAELGKILVVMGVIAAVVGAALILLGRTGFKGLPGDVRYEGENVRFYFPIVTCVVLSIALTAGTWLWQWFTRR